MDELDLLKIRIEVLKIGEQIKNTSENVNLDLLWKRLEILKSLILEDKPKIIPKLPRL